MAPRKSNGQLFENNSLSPAPSQHLSLEDHEALDEAEQLARDYILDDDDGEEPGQAAEITTPLVAKTLPRFAIFRARPLFELFGTTDQQGMDELVYAAPKAFAVRLEEDCEMRRVRFYETVTTDGVIRIVYAFVPEKTARLPNTWLTSKLAALEAATTQWTTMRTRRKLSQYAYRPASKDHGEPKFSDLTPGQHLQNLKKLGLLVDSEDHPFFKKATDAED